jgi:hypothetical protein
MSAAFRLYEPDEDSLPREYFLPNGEPVKKRQYRPLPVFRPNSGNVFVKAINQVQLRQICLTC